MSIFDHAAAPVRPNRKPLGTALLSVVLHLTALAGVIGLQFTAIGDGPQVVSRLRAFVPEAPPPKPPERASEPTRAASRAAVNPDVAPAEAPRTIEPEPPAFDVAMSAGVPDMLTGARIPDLSAPPGITAAPATTPTPLPPQPVGGDIRAPARITYVAPVYPEVARAAHVEGRVVLEATIDEWGLVQHIVVRESVPLLDRAAIEAVSKWRYTPTRLNGQPIAIVMMVTVTFRLQD